MGGLEIFPGGQAVCKKRMKRSKTPLTAVGEPAIIAAREG